jgi:hypothetical protein
VLASVIKADVDLRLLPANLNPRLNELLGRCLVRDRKPRWHAIDDVRLEFIRRAKSIDPANASLLYTQAVVFSLMDRQDDGIEDSKRGSPEGILFGSNEK